jgi:hydroxymethylbilane synthase
LVLGTRGSKLAVHQSEWVRARIQELAPHVTVTLRRIQTSGDKILDVPLAKIGGKGLFVKEIEEALLSGEIDLAVHSMKDVPTELPPGLDLVCIPAREDARDALISRDGARFKDLPAGARVGTSSLRRQAQLLQARPDLSAIWIPAYGNYAKGSLMRSCWRLPDCVAWDGSARSPSTLHQKSVCPRSVKARWESRGDATICSCATC